MSSTKTHARRAQNIAGFATFMAETVKALGGIDVVAAQCNTGTRQVWAWTHGESIPYVRTLLAFADQFGLDRATVLEAAGKPPLVALRAAMAVDDSTTLPSMLCAWRDAHHPDTAAAAAAMGISRFEFSRYANGSTELRGIRPARQIATALGISVEAVLAAASSEGTTLEQRCAARSTGLPGLLRDAFARIGLELVDPSDVAEAAGLAKIHGAALRCLLTGTRTLDFLTAQKVAKHTGTDLAALLVGAGTDPNLAAALAGAVGHLTHRRKEPTLGALLRAYRLSAELTQSAVATAIGTTHNSTVTFYEKDRSVPSVDTLVVLAATLHAPLERLLQAARQVA